MGSGEGRSPPPRRDDRAVLSTCPPLRETVVDGALNSRLEDARTLGDSFVVRIEHKPAEP